MPFFGRWLCGSLDIVFFAGFVREDGKYKLKSAGEQIGRQPVKDDRCMGEPVWFVACGECPLGGAATADELAVGLAALGRNRMTNAKC